jgi:hypothetical protein
MTHLAPAQRQARKIDVPHTFYAQSDHPVSLVPHTSRSVPRDALIARYCSSCSHDAAALLTVSALSRAWDGVYNCCTFVVCLYACLNGGCAELHLRLNRTIFTRSFPQHLDLARTDSKTQRHALCGTSR